MLTTHWTSAALARVPARIAGRATLRIDPSMNASDEAATDMTSVQPGWPRIISSPAFAGEGDRTKCGGGALVAARRAPPPASPTDASGVRLRASSACPRHAGRYAPLPEKSQGG